MTQRHDSYLGFAGHYDVHGWDWYAPTYGPRFFRLLEQRGIVPRRVLDAGCGTGTMALAMAERGWRVTGIDLSEAMLTMARRKDVRQTVTWSRADITRFDLDKSAGAERFDLITCVADTLNHLERLDDWEAAFRCFAEHLEPGGILFFDAMTSRGLSRLDKFTVLDVDDRALILGVIYEPSSRRSTVKATSFIPKGGSDGYEKATETITEWGQPVAEIMKRLSLAGFVEAGRLWSDEKDPEKEDRLAVLARRS